MTKAVSFHKLGDPGVLQIEDIALGDTPAGHVRLRAEAGGLNRGESLFRRGKYAYQPIFPSLVGGEGTGVIEAIGEDVKGWSVGQRVCLIPLFRSGVYGLLAERATVPQEALVPCPPSLSPVEAAALWVAYSTAYALVELTAIRAGDPVIITAASSSVGIAAIQIANAHGAVPIATTRSRSKIERLRELGAAHVILTAEQDLTEEVMRITNGQGARIAFDPIGGPLVEQLAAAMTSEGTILIYGNLSGQSTTYPHRLAASKGLSLRGFVAPNQLWGIPERFARLRDYIVKGVAAGSLSPVVAKTFPLDQVVEAFRYLESDDQVGKVVVTI